MSDIMLDTYPPHRLLPPFCLGYSGTSNWHPNHILHIRRRPA
ncbi:unnamed protein product [Haemonchus placei]|uniref:Uncharacterized protein n=1 Tax=Haemonchus placei TaxID=6290 RepID=A0A0N4WTV2_HAEPC|nr:unnamed protein product [Haemonchus placei]